jgi:hypothetical protein
VWVIDPGCTPRSKLDERPPCSAIPLANRVPTSQGIPERHDGSFTDQITRVLRRAGHADEYPPTFAVYRLPAHVASQLDFPSWDGMAAQGELLGRVAPRQSSSIRPGAP